MGVKIHVRDGESLLCALNRLDQLILETKGWPVYLPPWHKKRQDRFERRSVFLRRKRLVSAAKKRQATAFDSKPFHPRVKRDWHKIDLEFEDQAWVLRRCLFVLRRFVPFPALISVQANSEGLIAFSRYHGQSFDPRKYFIEHGGWDHEHCCLRHVHVFADDMYWVNIGKDDMCFCDVCFQHYRQRLQALV